MSDAAANISPPPQPPRLVGLYRDRYDDHGNAVGWTVVAWGAVYPDLSTVTIPVDSKTVSATVWHTLDDALTDLDVQVCEVNPRSYPQWWRDR